MNSIGYYPGCSLASGGIELDLSIRSLCNVAGVELQEIDDWNCCGATAAHSLNHDLAVALPYRTLALAEEQGLREVLAPCASCFSRLKGTVVRLKRDPSLRDRMHQLTRRRCDNSVAILSLVEFANRLMEKDLGGKLANPLKDTKVAAYYGCLLSRGEGINEGIDAENPTSMDAAIQAAGCRLVGWNHACECCGGGFSMSMTGAVVDLSAAILEDARAAGADLIVTCCPMCHSNLDMRQRTIRAARGGQPDMPVLYLSELLCLAAGLEPKEIGLNRHFVDAMCVARRRD